MTIKPKIIENYIKPNKQGAKRHYGVHPYFTRRPWNVVQDYIRNYTTQENRIVLDPFGGSGITAIETAVLGGHGIHFDINPLANFLTREISRTDFKIPDLYVSINEVLEISNKILKQKSSSKILSEFWFPSNVLMPKNADVRLVENLFSNKQLAELSVLREVILTTKNSAIRGQLLLIFSAVLGKTNKTFISSKNRAPSRGGSTIFSLYRYHVPKNPVLLSPIEEFLYRSKKFLVSKEDVFNTIGKTKGTVRVVDGSATNLDELRNETVDYIFTDPPYGDYINYLDLSIIWNSWLELDVSKKLRNKDVLPKKGNCENYFHLLNEAANECFRVLKRGSFLNLVFCHRDLSYWKRIFEIFETAGFSYITSVPQPLSVVWSMHKKKSDLSSIAGELIITFYKQGKVKLGRKRITSYKSISQALDHLFKTRSFYSTDELALNLIPILYESDLLINYGSNKALIWNEVEEYIKYNKYLIGWEMKY